MTNNTKPAQELTAGKLDGSGLPVNRVSEGSSNNRTAVRTGAIKKIFLVSIAIAALGLVAAKHVNSQNDSKLTAVTDVALNSVEALGGCIIEVDGTEVAECGGRGTCITDIEISTIDIEIIIVCSGTHQ